MMKKLSFTVAIVATKSDVYRLMLGLDDKSTYDEWVAVFSPTSTYEGSWEPGAQIRFVAIDENGEKGGLLVEVQENKPNEFVSLCTVGFIQGDEAITTGKDVENWLGGFETYTYEENDGVTTVTATVDVFEDHLDYFEEKYPQALAKLKEMAERK